MVHLMYHVPEFLFNYWERGVFLVEDRTFRNAMGRFATGVTVITVKDEEGTHGMTANAFMSVSLDPKLVLVSIDNNASMLEKMKSATSFGISFLREEQKHLSMHFAGQKLYDGDIEYDVIDGVPVLRHSLAALVCTFYQQVPAGDHTLFLAEVDEILFDDGDPLTFYKGQYGKIKDSE